MPLIDFSSLREMIDMEAFLRAVRYPIASYLRVSAKGPCPANCYSDNRSCSFQFKWKKWKCWRCGARGDLLDLVERVIPRLNGPYECAIEICRIFRIEVPYKAEPVHRRKRERKDVDVCSVEEDVVDS